MRERIDPILSRVTEEIFEKLAFMFSYPEEGFEAEIDSPAAAPPVVTEVFFKGPFSGRLVMSLSPRLLPELAGNMLGADDNEATTPDQQYDALKELINVICGNLLPKIAGKQAIFNVNTPKIIDPEGIAPTAEEILLGDTGLLVEDEKCDLRLYGIGGIPDRVFQPDSGADAPDAF
jgi:CheY-specific phosphatase CheX